MMSGSKMGKRRAPYRFGLSIEEKKIWRRYQKHKINAENRGIDFLLSFEEWLQIWTASGHLAESGRGKTKYCMARFGDKGACEVGNVRICTNQENQDELLRNPLKLEEIGSGMRGKSIVKKLARFSADCVLGTSML